MSNLFWNDVRTEPKRRFRFELKFSSRTLGQGAIPVWTIKTASKPKANVSTIEHQYIDHTFKYPGRVTWDPISITLVDPVDPDLSYAFLDVLGAAGYKFPTTASRSKLSLSKKLFAEQIALDFNAPEFIAIHRLNQHQIIIRLDVHRRFGELNIDIPMQWSGIRLRPSIGVQHLSYKIKFDNLSRIYLELT